MKSERIFLWAPGATSDVPTEKLRLGLGSFNLYHDQGYLTNYPGRTDSFLRKEDYEVYEGEPPALAAITRLLYFRDVWGYPHLVFVQDGELRERLNNGYRTLATITGIQYDGLYFPTLFVHEAKLVIVNGGMAPLVWDGVNGVVPLGVPETPAPPDARASQIPGSELDCHLGLFAWAHFWWPQETPPSGPGSNKNTDGDPIFGIYTARVQFTDLYGNRSAPSSPSVIVKVSTPFEITPTVGDAYSLYEYMVVDWRPPTHEDSVHVTGYLLGRTLNQHPEDPSGGPAAASIHFLEKTLAGTTLTRHTCQLSDATLAALPTMDTLVHAPRQATQGVSWKGRIYLWGHEDAYVISWSDYTYFGQFRDTQLYRARSKVTRVLGAGDRLLVISEASVEVLYETDTGLGILQQDFSEGSVYGRSFVQVSDTTVFGRWNKGFGYYDGNSPIKYVRTPDWLLSYYLDPLFFLPAAVVWKQWYVLSVRLNLLGESNNTLLLYDMAAEEWYVLNESVRDLAVLGEELLGADDSLYVLFRGIPAAATAIVNQLVPPQGVALERHLLNVSLFMEASSAEEAELTVQAQFLGESATSSTFPLMPSLHHASRSSHLPPTWDMPGRGYNDNTYAAAPGDFWLSPDMSQPVAGSSHTIVLKFPAGHVVRLKALAMEFAPDKTRDY